jgi:hypothetical protein
MALPSPIISKPPSAALADSPDREVTVLYSMNASLETNIVSLAPESIKVGTFPFWKFWKPLQLGKGLMEYP